jgi:uncharacterized protein
MRRASRVDEAYLDRGGSTALLLLLLACGPQGGAVPEPGAVPIAADHHVHILGPQLVRDWKSLGAEFSRPDSAYTSVTAVFGTTDVQAFLVSMAHIYGSDHFRSGLDLAPDAEHLRVQRANDHVAHEVARAPESFVGFCSVDLLRPYASTEIERCRDRLGVAGLKLHLPAAGFDLTSPAHLRVLASIARQAAGDGRPLLIHLAPIDGELRQEELRAFIDHVVRPNPELELYLAHLGGNGGYRASARRVVQGFTAFLGESDDNAARRIYFDLSGALLARTTDGIPASRRSHARALASDLRTLGFERVVFGSDYPVFDPDSSARLLQDLLPLAFTEVAKIMENRAPALDRVRAHGIASDP